jgi:hypothetical protein
MDIYFIYVPFNENCHSYTTNNEMLTANNKTQWSLADLKQ